MGERRQPLPAQWSPGIGKPFLTQEVAKKTNCFQPIHHLLVLCKKPATGFGIIKRIFKNTNESCFCRHSLWEAAGGNYYWPDRVSNATEPTERCHQQGTCDGPSWWRDLMPCGWVRETTWLMNLTIHNYFGVIIKAWYASQNHRTYMSIWFEVS